MSGILRQSLWLFLAQGISRAIGFFYTIFLARNLGVENFGLYSVALAYFSLISIIAEFGFNRFLVRELSLNKLRVSELIFNIALLRLLITFFMALIFGIGLFLLDPDKARTNLSFLMILAVFPNALAQTLDSVFVAFQKLQFSAISVVLTNILIVVIGISLVLNNFGPTGVALALIFGQVFYAGVLFVLQRWQNINISTSIVKNILKEVLAGAIPYGILGVLGLLYFKIDMLMLSYIKGNFDTGIYSAAYRFYEAAAMIPSSISIALFPVLTKLHQVDILNLKKIYYKGLILLGGLGLLVLIVMILLVPSIINNFLPQYQQSIGVLMILSLSIPFLYMISPQSAVFLTSEQLLKPLIFISIFNLLFNASLNFLLIPKLSFIGSAWSTVLSDILGFLIFFFYLKVALNKKK